jgi:RNA polymerase sigma-70 factor (ECF subfamily)
VIGMEDMALPRPSAPEIEEQALVAGMQAGDDDAYELCVRRFCDRLLAVARRILNNDEDARDAIQDAFASAFREIVRFEARSGLGTWLHRIAVNAALARLRSRQRRPEKSIEDLLPHFGEDEHQIDPPSAWSSLPASRLEQQETRDLVQQCILKLPEMYRNVLVLRDIEEIDTEDVARMLGTSVGVVKTRLHRARQALRTLLNPHFREGER